MEPTEPFLKTLGFQDACDGAVGDLNSAEYFTR